MDIIISLFVGFFISIFIIKIAIAGVEKKLDTIIILLRDGKLPEEVESQNSTEDYEVDSTNDFLLR